MDKQSIVTAIWKHPSNSGLPKAEINWVLDRYAECTGEPVTAERDGLSSITSRNAIEFLAHNDLPETKRLFLSAFSFGRPPRSSFYAVGVLHAIRNRVGRAILHKCPYTQGTVNFDAYMAGYSEGRNTFMGEASNQESNEAVA